MSCRTALSVLLALMAGATLASGQTLRSMDRANAAAGAAQGAGSVTSGALVATESPSGEAPSLLDEDEEAEADESSLAYDARGRRDPFQPLTGEATSDAERAKWVGTLRGLLWSEVKLTTIMKTPSGNVAMFEGGARKEGYFAREGDQFWNATVHRIDYDLGTVTLRVQLNDPKLLKPWRDETLTLKGMAPPEEDVVIDEGVVDGGEGDYVPPPEGGTGF